MRPQTMRPLEIKDFEKVKILFLETFHRLQDLEAGVNGLISDNSVIIQNYINLIINSGASIKYVCKSTDNAGLTNIDTAVNILFNTLVDQNGNTLPATISNAMFILIPESERKARVAGYSSTYVTLEGSVAGDVCNTSLLIVVYT